MEDDLELFCSFICSRFTILGLFFMKLWREAETVTVLNFTENYDKEQPPNNNGKLRSSTIRFQMHFFLMVAIFGSERLVSESYYHYSQ